jgi:hypothetical protein
MPILMLPAGSSDMSQMLPVYGYLRLLIVAVYKQERQVATPIISKKPENNRLK